MDWNKFLREIAIRIQSKIENKKISEERCGEAIVGQKCEISCLECIKKDLIEIHKLEVGI